MFNTKLRYIIISLSLLTFIALIASFIIKKPKIIPEIVYSDPKNKSVKVDLGKEVLLRFNQPLDPSLLKIVSSPEETWTNHPIDSKNIRLKHEYALYPHTEYRLTLTYDGEYIGTLDFTTIASQSDPRLVQTIEEEVKRDYPLAAKTPYVAPDFTVVYSKPLTLEITLKDGVDERSVIINTVRDWVKENGLDPDSHTYTFSN